MKKLKNLYTQDFITKLASAINQHYPKFKLIKFKQQIFNSEWKHLELKQRIRHISLCLGDFLPKNYIHAIDILQLIAHKFSGIEAMFFQDFVEVFGLEYFSPSMKALEKFTEFSSSEFAIRQFLIKNKHQTIQQMLIWAKSKNHHHRRLASEGIRPLLPWACVLLDFKKDPTAIFLILEILKDDKSLYVRKSVANNLNDISKNQPNLVLEIAKKWQGKNKNIDKIIKHGLRTLLKQANLTALELFGFYPPNHIKIKNFNCNNKVKIGDILTFNFELYSNISLGKIRLEYQIDFIKKNKKIRAKIFQISESQTDKNTKKVNKEFNFKQISTRVYYPGKHKIGIIINGINKQTLNFMLIK